LAGRGVFTYESKEVYKLFENTLEAPILLDLKLGAYIENSNLPFQFEDFQRRYSLETFSKEDFNGNLELVKLWHSDQLGRYFIQNLDSKLLNLWQNVESPLARVLAVMETNGIYIDQAKLQEISNQLSSETERLEAEIKAKADAEAKAKRDAEAQAAAELKAKQIAEAKAAKAPKKQKLSTWINSMSAVAPVGLEQDQTAVEIIEKFEAFKKWAAAKVESL
jgi:hypothetical protein